MHRIWVSVLGTGYSPLIPGTCGSAVVLAVFTAVAILIPAPAMVAVIMLVVAVQGAVVTVAYGDRVIARHGPDPSVIVSDEQCGQALTYLCYLWTVSANAGTREIMAFALVGFVLFRLFDIIKPPPIRLLEKIKDAWGVLLDDVMAAVYAGIVLQVVWRLGWLERLWS